MARPAIERSQGNVGPTFIHNHQASGIQLLHLLTPTGSLFLPALRGIHRLFFPSRQRLRGSMYDRIRRGWQIGLTGDVDEQRIGNAVKKRE